MAFGIPVDPQLDQFDIEEMPRGTYYAEPRGNREGDSDSWLDFQFSKGFQIGRTELTLIVSVLNALSREDVTEVCEYVTGCDDFELGEAIEWETPRRWEVGLRFEF